MVVVKVCFNLETSVILWIHYYITDRSAISDNNLHSFILAFFR